jgi:UDP-sugar pyrophosphorylase
MTAHEEEITKMLLEEDQSHVFQGWAADGDEDKKHAFFESIDTLNAGYPGGLPAYLKRARELLASSAAGDNPFEGMTPSVPAGEKLDFGSDEFLSMERRGMSVIGDCAFVLVAGGLGERLGYGGIKISLPTESTTEMCYIELYVQQILALQRQFNAANGTSKKIPLAIMTSGDTHDKTVALLAARENFGMEADQIVLLKQDKVAALVDNDAHVAVSEDSPYELLTKPHGHGDVHTLLHSSGTARRWKEEGRKYLMFLQDTNAFCFFVSVAAIGVSAERGFAMNSVTIPRVAGEAVGAIVKLEKADGTAVTGNVEYNQLAPLLQNTLGHGDQNDESGYSPFPGNINQLIMDVDSYCRVLERTSGLVTEFVNPKYKDETKTTFKKPTRLECMMQDHAYVIPAEETSGFTQLEAWTYSPVKNSITEGLGKASAGVPPRVAAEGEMEMYDMRARQLRLIGCDVEADGEFSVSGFTFPHPAHIVLHPSVGMGMDALSARFPAPSDVHISQRSTLVVSGDVTIQSLTLDGALTISAAPGAKVTIKSLTVKNDGCELIAIEEGAEVPEWVAIRGFTHSVKEMRSIECTEGEQVVEE